MSDWKKEYGRKRNYCDFELVESQARKQVSYMLTDHNNRVINAMEEYIHGKFEWEDDAITFYMKHCSMYIEEEGALIRLYIDGKLWREWSNNLEIVQGN